MPGFRGRALIYPGLLIAGWIVGRSITLSATPTESPMEQVEPKDVQLASVQTLEVGSACPMQLLPYPLTMMPNHRPNWPRYVPSAIERQPKYILSIDSNGPAKGFASASNGIVPLAEDFQLAVLPVAQPTEKAGATTSTALKTRRLQFYSYNFWRQGSAGAALAPNAQYGGSQYGAIATWDPLGSPGKGPALLVRAAGTPDGLQQEVAVGARWQPDRKWPVSLSVERRFRFYGPDGFAAYIAGGVDRVPLFGKLALDAYGQAGYSLGGISSPFVDAQARVQHPLAKPLGVPIRIGAGAWVGGQKGAYRADIGPTLSAQINNRFADFTLQVDWRKRVVGNAAPVDGLALTVSTDF